MTDTPRVMSPEEFRDKYRGLLTDFMHWHLLQDVEAVVRFAESIERQHKRMELVA